MSTGPQYLQLSSSYEKYMGISRLADQQVLGQSTEIWS